MRPSLEPGHQLLDDVDVDAVLERVLEPGHQLLDDVDVDAVLERVPEAGSPARLGFRHG